MIASRSTRTDTRRRTSKLSAAFPPAYPVRRRPLPARRRKSATGRLTVLLILGIAIAVFLRVQASAGGAAVPSTGATGSAAHATSAGSPRGTATVGRNPSASALGNQAGSPWAVQEQAREILDGAGGTTAMIAAQPDKPATVSLNATQSMPAASLYKLGVMAAVFQAVADGEFPLDRQVTIPQDEVAFYGDAPATAAGTTLSVREALERMITISDNSAAGALIDLVGADKVNAAFLANGMPQSHLGSGPGVEPRTVAETTAADQAIFYQRLLAGQVVSRAASEDMLTLLQAQRENDRLPAKLPAGTLMAHKTGELDGVRNDSGIIFTPNGPLVCVVLISDQPEASRAVDAIADAGLLVYQWLASSRPPPP